jgi:hypothetical protein
MASARQICTTTAINTVSCYKSNCIPASHGNPGDCRFVGASNTRQLRLVKLQSNGVSETNLHGVTTAINTVSCYKSNCIPASHGNPGDCRFVRASNTRQLRLVKRNGVSETNLHNHCNQHGQLLQIQLHSSVARQSRRLSIRPSVEHAPTEIGQTKWRQRDKSAQPLQSTRSVVTNPIAFQRRTAIQAIVDSSERRTRAN